MLEKYQILESPSNRKVHSSETPSIGGFPVFFGILISIILWWPAEIIGEYKVFIASVVLMFFIGLKDDILPMRASHKLVSQLLPIALVAGFGLTIMTSFYGLLGIENVPWTIAIILTAFTYVVILNSVNLIDGIDGLAAGVGVIILLFYGVWFQIVGEVGLAAISITCLGGFLAFLYFNWQPSKIFMGDTGALVLGFVIAFLTLSFLSVNHSMVGSSAYKFTSSVGTALGILFVPLFDTLRVFIIRVLSGESPFQPDKKHIHHVLLRTGLNHSQVSTLLILVSILVGLLCIVFNHFGDLVLITILTALGLTFSFCLQVVEKRSAAVENSPGFDGQTAR